MIFVNVGRRQNIFYGTKDLNAKHNGSDIFHIIIWYENTSKCNLISFGIPFHTQNRIFFVIRKKIGFILHFLKS